MELEYVEIKTLSGKGCQVDDAVKCPANVTKKLASRRERHFRNSGILPSNRGTTGGAAGARVDKMVRRTNSRNMCARASVCGKQA